MEVIKKTILQAVTTGTTTGCTGTCRVIIPDLTKIYYIKFSLTQDNQDYGFFDVYDDSIISEIDNNIEGGLPPDGGGSVGDGDGIEEV